jgi:DNA-binding PadR family transcriptional regulator
MLEKEYNNMRTGYLTLYILKYIEMKPKVNMSPFGALIAQEIDLKNQLGAGKSLVFSKLNKLCEGGYLSFSWKESPNPRVKKKVKFFSITAKGKKLILKLQNEQKRINQVLDLLPA